MTKLNIEPEVIHDLYFRIGSIPPREQNQKALERKLIESAYLMGYSEATLKLTEQKANSQKPPADGDGRMDIRSQGTVKGVIYNSTRYIRFSFFDEWLNEEFADWWIREPLDVLTKVRDRETITTLNKAYSDATGD